MGSVRMMAKKTQTQPLPDGFSLDEDLAKYARDRLPQVDAPAMFETFCDLAAAKGWQYADWRRAWYVYVRNAMPTSGHWAAGHYPKAKVDWSASLKPSDIRW